MPGRICSVRRVAIAFGLLLLCGHAQATQLLVPAYFGTGPLWTELTAAAQRGTPITAILNPDSGPGTSADPQLSSAVKAFEAAGGTVLGYVSTNYGESSAGNSLAENEAEVNTYQSYYPIDGIFLDEMSDSTKSSTLNYYSSLYTYIKHQSASFDVIGNPGTGVDQAYEAVADTLVTYEDVGSDYATNVPEPWTTTASAKQFANIVIEVPDAAAMLADLAQARSQNVGYVYFTDDGADGNPYDSLPSYFQAEVAALPEPTTLLVGALVSMAVGRRHRHGD